MASQNSYEEIRRQRVQENLKHLEDLGISAIKKSLLDVAKSEHKLLKSQSSLKTKKMLEITEVRRSSRARNHVASYRDEVGLAEHRVHRRSYSRSGNSGRLYHGRVASYEEQILAMKTAEKLQCELKSGHPSFIKPMVRSHVSSCFWLGLPTKFCKKHLPPNELHMLLEDEEGSEYDSIYIGKRTGLSGGWRGFAMDHNLEDGDVLVFELREPDRFKIYITKACGDLMDNKNISDVEGSRERLNAVQDNCFAGAPKPQAKNEPSKKAGKAAKRKRR